MNVGLEATAAVWKDAKLKPTAAMWLYDDDASEWRFLIATNDAKKRGPQAAYLRVRTIRKKAGLLDRLPLGRVTVADPDNPVLFSIVRLGASISLGHTSIYCCPMKPPLIGFPWNGHSGYPIFPIQKRLNKQKPRLPF
jgi:hypothetical protein